MGTHKFHGKDRDLFLDKNGLNEVSASELRSHLDILTAPHIIYVDAHRVDTYTPDGTKYKPYKTYFDAISSITDNSVDKRYVIKILGKTTEPDSDLPIKACVFVEGYQMQSSVIKVQPGRSLIWDAQDGSGQESGYTGFKDITISRTDYSTTDLIKVLRTTVTPVSNWCIFELSGCSIRGDVIFYGKGVGRDYFQVYDTVFLAGNLDIKNAYIIYHNIATWGNSYVTSDSAGYKLGDYDCYYIVESSQFYADSIIKTLGASDGLWAGAVNSALQGAVTIDKFAGSILSVDFDSPSYPNNLTLTGNPTLSRLTEGESIKNDSSVTGDNVKEALDNLDSIKLEDAPSDGKTYGRKDAVWEEVIGGGVMFQYVTVGTSGADYDNFDDAIDYLRILNGGRIIVITDMVITSTAVKDISHIQIEGCNFYSGTIKISKTVNGGYWYGKNVYIKDISFNRMADTGANEIFCFTADYQDVILEWVSCIGFGAPFNSPKVFNINGFESHIITKGTCLLGALAADWHPFLNPLKLVLHIYDRTGFYGASDTFDACFMTDSTVIEGTPTFTSPGHPVKINKASGMDNDSSVTGDTVKDALETLNTTKYEEDNEIKIKVYSQDDEPVLSADHKMAVWIDTDDSNRVYLVFRRGSGDQVAIELA